MFGTNRDELRQSYIDAWSKRDAPQTLTPLQKQILAVILEHPEYHAMFDDPERLRQNDFTPEQGQSNPFLHLGMHLAIRDQVAIKQPPEIVTLYADYVSKHRDDHLEAEHDMIEAFITCLWESLRYQKEFDNAQYVELLKQRVS